MYADFNIDADSRIGTHFHINPTLKGYVPRPQTTLEFERTIVTRYSSGSHSLANELGRMSNIDRNDHQFTRFYKLF